jgi:hypothetical protein
LHVLSGPASTGLLVKMLRDRGYDAEGIELNATSAAYGREHFGVTIHNRPLERCGFEPRSLNGLVMTDVLEPSMPPDSVWSNSGVPSRRPK